MQDSNVRILEIGEYNHFKLNYPERTTLLWTGWRPYRDDPAGVFDCTHAQFARAMRDVHAGRYDVVVVYPPLRSGWEPYYWARSFAHTPLKPYSSLTRVTGVSWLRLVRIPIPLVAVDISDHYGIGRHNFFLLDKANVYFKRELPVDRWQTLTGTAHPYLPTTRIRKNRRWQARLERVRPITLPMPLVDAHGLWTGDEPAKTTDVFFSGHVAENSWVRRVGMNEIETMRARGIKVDVPTTTIPQAEFYRRMSQAWLAWSPSGYGWQCYRTGEAPQCLTVPVVNHPTIERSYPLLNEQHLVQYDVEPGGLVRAVEAALADKDKLRRMAVAARNHVLAHHTMAAFLDHVVETALSFKNTKV